MLICHLLFALNYDRDKLFNVYMRAGIGGGGQYPPAYLNPVQTPPKFPICNIYKCGN